MESGRLYLLWLFSVVGCVGSTFHAFGKSDTVLAPALHPRADFPYCIIERIPINPGKLLCNLMTVFMIINMAISALALARYAERNTLKDSEQIQDPVSAQDWLNNFLDEHYDDERMARIYPNAKIVVDGRPMYIAP